MTQFDKRDRADRRKVPDKFNGSKWSYRENDGVRLRYVSHGCGYVMVRKPHAMPFVIREREWLALPLFDASARTEGTRQHAAESAQ